MALSDLISKPVASPLEGFDKSVQTGFELAQNQDRIQIAREQVNLQQQQINDSYMSKAIGMLPSYLKATGKSRKLIGNAFASLWQRSGNTMNPEIMDLINSDDQMSEGVLSEYERLNKLYNGDPILVGTALRDKFGSDQTDFIERMLLQQAQAKAELGKSLGIFERQERGFNEQRRKVSVANTNKAIDSVDKTLDGMLPKLVLMETTIGTVDKPKSFTMVELKNLLPTIAKTIGGETGVLTEQDVKNQLANTLEMDAATLQSYLDMGTKAPLGFQKLLRERYSAFKQGLISAVGSKLFDRIQQGGFSDSPELFSISAPNKNGIVIGQQAKQLIDKANSALKNTRTNTGVFNVMGFINQSATPPSQQEIFDVIKQQNKLGRIIYFGRSAPTYNLDQGQINYTFDPKEMQELEDRKQELLRKKAAASGQYVGPLAPSAYAKPMKK